MVWKQIRVALLVGAVLAVAAVNARAGNCNCGGGAVVHGSAAAGTVVADGSAPQYTTVYVQEMVPETYTTTRTVNRMEQRTETYTAYRSEMVAETRTRTVMHYKMVPEVKTITKCVKVSVPVEECRTGYKTQWTCKPVTKVERKCVDHGHYECQLVPAKPTLMERLGKLCRKNDCCECEECPKMVTKKVWVPNKVWEEHCVTVMEKVCEKVPYTYTVKTCKWETRQETCQVTVNKCVCEPRTETYTVNVCKKVPYTATRCVSVCVPHTENVTCTRMVCRTVARQVPCAPACEPACDACEAATCCEREGLFGKLMGKFRGFGKKSKGCDSCCEAAPACGCGCN